MPQLSDWWLLQLVLVLMYLCACVRWVHPNSLVVEIGWRGRVGLRLPNYQFALCGRVPVWLNPRTPWRASVVVEPIPVCVSTDGILLAPCQELRPPPYPNAAVQWVEWSEVPGFWSESKWVHLGKTRVRATNECIAAQLASELRGIWQMDPADRDQRIEAFVERVVAPGRVRADVNRLLDACAVLRFACCVLCVLLFVALPITIAVMPERSVHVLYASLMALGWVLIAYRLAAKRVKLSSITSIKQVFTMLLDPPAAIRAIDRIAIDFFKDVAWNAVSVIPGADQRKPIDGVLMMCVRDLLNPPSRGSDTHSEDRSFVGRIVRQLRRDPAFCAIEFLAKKEPVREGPHAHAYCAKCLGQFQNPGERCACCGSISVVSFD